MPFVLRMSPICTSSTLCKVMCGDGSNGIDVNLAVNIRIYYQIMLATLDTASNINLGGPNRLVAI